MVKLSHPPERIKDLPVPLFAGSADLAVGSRYVKGGSTPGWSIWRRIVSPAGAGLAYLLTGLDDSISGFFANTAKSLVLLGEKGSLTAEISGCI